jgi:hypothetical protein
VCKCFHQASTLACDLVRFCCYLFAKSSHASDGGLAAILDVVMLLFDQADRVKHIQRIVNSTLDVTKIVVVDQPTTTKLVLYCLRDLIARGHVTYLNHL